MKDSKLKQILIILMMLSMGLFLISCGSSGGGDDSPQLDLVSGVAATGAPMTGNVTLKDSNDILIGPQAIAADGSFSFDVTGLTPPFYIRAEDSITGEFLYSVSMESGTGNVNPLTNLAVAIAAGVSDPAMVYDDPASYPITQPALNKAIADLLAMFEPLFEKHGCKGQNPLTDHFKANHKGLDALFDDVTIDLGSGVASFKDKHSGSKICVMSVPGMDITDPLISVVGNGSALPVWLNIHVNELSLSESVVNGGSDTEFFGIPSITEVNVLDNNVIEILGSGTCSDISDISDISEGSEVLPEACTFTVTLTDSNPDVLDVVLLDSNGIVIYSYFNVKLTEDTDFVVTYLINN